MTFNQISTTTKVCGLVLTMTTINSSVNDNNHIILKNNTNIEKKMNKSVEMMTSNKEIRDEWLGLSSNMKMTKDKEKFYSVSELIEEKLQKSSYNWRTKEGLLKDTGIPINILTNTLNEMAKKGKIYIGMKEDGTNIFSLVETYKKNTKIILKLKDLLLGEILR